MASFDPTADIDGPKVPAGLPKALSEAEVESVLSAVGGDGPLARRDLAILEVLYGTGVRISELVGLCMSDLDLSEHMMKVLGKGGKERLVPVGGCAARALGEWLGASGRALVVPKRWAKRSDATAVFLNRLGARLTRQGAWLVVRRYGTAVGLSDRLTPHVLRHSCATHMLNHGADIRVVQELLGHASITTTQIYTRVTPEHLRRAYESAHPRAQGRGTH
jgi:integrase/recombinase XerD